MPADTAHAHLSASAIQQQKQAAAADPVNGCLTVNADDWGRDSNTTDLTYDCIRRGTVSAVSAMVFMEDSERAFQIAQESGVDTGLHLNFSAPFTADDCPPALIEHHRRLMTYLRRHAMARVVFHPGLQNSFEYSVEAQLEAFQELYSAPPERLDGHHHMHLCANVQRAKLIPAGTLVRRNFYFQPGEKSWLNRVYRKRVDHALALRHRLVDFLFALPPLEPSRLKRIFALAADHTVEVETHPVNANEYVFLTGDGMADLLGEGLLVEPFPRTAKKCNEKEEESAKKKDSQ